MNKKRIFVIMLLLALCFSVFATARTVDLQRQVSLDIIGIPIADMKFYAYLISEYTSDGELKYDEDFADCQIPLDEEEDPTRLADELMIWVITNGITPDAECVSRENKTASFNEEDLKHGVYFVTSDRVLSGESVYCVCPFIVSLPLNYNGADRYDVVADAKFEVLPSHDTYSVCKVWNDDGAEDLRPQNINIALYCDGEVYDRIQLPFNGSWEYKWNDLPTDHLWWAREESVSDYTAISQRSGTSFVIINTFTGTRPPSEDIPSTGQPWWPVPIMVFAGLALVASGLIIRRRSV